VPCQYWYNDQWYDLTSLDNSVSFFETDHVMSSGEYAVYNFCQKINAATQEIAGLGCDSQYEDQTNAYSTIINAGVSGKCEAASTDSLSSIDTSEFTLPDKSTTFGLMYSNPTNGCSLHVGLICDDTVDGYVTSALSVALGETGCNY